MDGPGQIGRGGWRRFAVPAMFAVWLASSGCTGFWDEVSSRDFKVKDMFHKTDPLLMLRDSTDGDRRAQALRRLQEPKQHGGSTADQDLYVEILTKAAWNEKQSLCRLAAIQTLRDYKDPRVVEGLKEAYYRASTFNPETATILRCAALESLGETRQPAAVELLVKVMREPPVEGSEQDRQWKADERIAATRALGHFNHYQGTSALVYALETEKDVALKNRAHESLQMATGKKYPADAKLWADFLNDPATMEKSMAGDKGFLDQMLEILPASWRK